MGSHLPSLSHLYHDFSNSVKSITIASDIRRYALRGGVVRWVLSVQPFAKEVSGMQSRCLRNGSICEVQALWMYSRRSTFWRRFNLSRNWCDRQPCRIPGNHCILQMRILQTSVLSHSWWHCNACYLRHRCFIGLLD